MLRSASLRLNAAGSPSGRLDAARLLGAVLERESGWFLAHDTEPLQAASHARFEALLRRREAGEPVAYLTGSVGFYGRTFAVTRDVLVPRPESEELIEHTIAHLRARALPSATLCDVGTGSGILAITAACELPALRGTAIDVSPQALNVARANARALGVEARIEFLCGDLLLPAGSRRFDAVVANLPYVESAALAPAPDPTSFEPALALDGGADGLDLYRRLLEGLPARLNPGAAVFLEAGERSAPTLVALAAAAFPAALVRLQRDYAAQPRIVEIEL